MEDNLQNKLSELTKENKYLNDIKNDLGKVIDHFVMLHYLTKELQEQTTLEMILIRFLTSLTSPGGFSLKSANLYFVEGLLKEYDIVDEKLSIKTYTGEHLKLIEKILSSNEDYISESQTMLIMPLHSDQLKGVLKVETTQTILEPEFIKLIEIFALQMISISENIILRDQIAEKAKTLEITNQELEEKNVELRQLQTQIIQQEKMASIGQLAAGVAHELNNPIGFILGNFNALKNYAGSLATFLQTTKDAFVGKENTTGCDLFETLNEQWEDNNIEFIMEDMPQLIVESEDGLERVISIVKNLKDFSRIDSKTEEEYDFNKGVENTLVIARNEYKYIADIEKDLGEIPPVIARGGEINEVLLNIIVNAAQAISSQESKEKKTIKVKTSHDDTFVTCEISDNGPGIPEHIRSKIFDPFFTTKEPGKGTGLGLSIAYNIIKKRHNGEINVESEVGKGTKFIIKLPKNNSEMENANTHAFIDNN